MSKATGLDFGEVGFNDNLDRNEGKMDSLASKTGLFSAGSLESDSGGVNKKVSGNDLEDLWITSWIKSRNYKPKSQGFLIDGKKGYIECMKMYVGDGGIEGGSIHIPNETVDDSFHTNFYGDSWWGCNIADLEASVDNANAYILRTGQAKFKNVVLSNSVTLSGLQAGSEIAIQGWQQDMVFSASDADTVAWTAGTITLLDGTTFSIDAGNTGNMSDFTYIYFSKSDSETVLQISTTASDAVGSNKILIGAAENNSDTSSKATFQIFGGKGGESLLIDNIAANSACVNELISNSAQIGAAIIGNAHITGTILVGHTEADVTADNAQAYGWLTGSKPPINADHTADIVSAMAYESMVEKAKLGTTIVYGGYIKANLLTAQNIVTGTMNAARINGGDINGVTITGVTIRTASSGARVQLDSSNYLQCYDSDYLRIKIDTDTIYFYNENGSERGRISGYGGDLYFNANNADFAGNLFCTGLNATSTISFAADLEFATSQYIKWGISQEFLFRHDGTNFTFNDTIKVDNGMICNTGSIDQIASDGRVRQYLCGLREKTEPSTPASGEVYIYYNSSNNNLEVKFSDGTIFILCNN